MKAQKLGLVLGMNMAVACLVLQGCKANRHGQNLPPPEVTTIDQPVDQPTQQPVDQPTDQPVITDVGTDVPAPSVPGAVPQNETMPTAPRTMIKPTPPQQPTLPETPPKARRTRPTAKRTQQTPPQT